MSNNNLDSANESEARSAIINGCCASHDKIINTLKSEVIITSDRWQGISVNNSKDMGVVYKEITLALLYSAKAEIDRLIDNV